MTNPEQTLFTALLFLSAMLLQLLDAVAEDDAEVA